MDMHTHANTLKAGQCSTQYTVYNMHGSRIQHPFVYKNCVCDSALAGREASLRAQFYKQAQKLDSQSALSGNQGQFEDAFLERPSSANKL